MHLSRLIDDLMKPHKMGFQSTMQGEQVKKRRGQNEESTRALNPSTSPRTTLSTIQFFPTYLGEFYFLSLLIPCCLSKLVLGVSAVLACLCLPWPFNTWMLDWLQLTQVLFMLPQLLGVHKCNHPALNGKPCVLDFYQLSLALTVFLFSFRKIPEPSRVRCEMPVLFRREVLSLLLSAIDQLNVSVLILIFCKEISEVFWHMGTAISHQEDGLNAHFLYQ